jgi:hypothetical protein
MEAANAATAAAEEAALAAVEAGEMAVAAAEAAGAIAQDALDAAQAAKYSPGRQLANLLLPESMEGSGLLYKGISGVTRY